MAPKLKAGLEIHQQLDTHKLFCNCPSILRNDKYKDIVARKLNPVVGETGKVDTAAQYEALKNTTYKYQIYDTNCLIELDEEPPHNINPEALKIALQISLLLNAKIFPVTQVMRKTVIDGSNTSGFQRTVLIAHDGYVQTAQGKVRIDTIALEEDSARKIKDEKGGKTYSLDRLGIPLVEITTAPDLQSPEQVKEAALKIGEILRACQVKRGIGTIRQDLNISIPKGNRIEIKGFQDPKSMLPTIDNEILRQQNILKYQKDIKKIDIQEPVEITSLYKQTKSEIINSAIKEEKGVYIYKLKKAEGILGKELNPQKRIATDLSEYTKPRAGVKGLMHSDEKLVEKYNISKNEIEKVEKEIQKRSGDGYIIILGTKQQAKQAYSAITERLQMLRKGVPKEVRNAQSNATTTYLRPMPTAARMYPETDIQLLRIKRQQVDELRKRLPKLASENKRYLQEFGINDELIGLIMKQNRLEDFKELTSVTDHYQALAKALTIYTTEISKKQNKPIEQIQEKLNNEIISQIFQKIPSEITEREVKPIMVQISEGITLAEAIQKEDIDITTEVKEIIKNKPGLSQGAYMGILIKKLQSKASGAEIAKTLTEEMKKLVTKKETSK